MPWSAVNGVPTNIPLLRALMTADAVERADFDTNWLGRFLADWNG